MSVFQHRLWPKSPRAALASVLLLIVCLLGTQWILAEHQTQLHSHGADEACELCMHGKTPDAVIASARDQSPRSREVRTVPANNNAQAGRSTYSPTLPRAPPRTHS